MDTPENPPLDELTPEQEALIAEAVESMKDNTIAAPYNPPSNTVVRTKDGGWYYVADSYERVIERIKEVMDPSQRNFIIFDVVGNEATRVCLDFATITAVIDLTPRVQEEAE